MEIVIATILFLALMFIMSFIGNMYRRWEIPKNRNEYINHLLISLSLIVFESSRKKINDRKITEIVIYAEKYSHAYLSSKENNEVREHIVNVLKNPNEFYLKCITGYLKEVMNNDKKSM